MKRVIFSSLTVLMFSSMLCTNASAYSQIGRWYSGYSSPSARSTWNYYGAHTFLTTPNYIVSLDTNTQYSIAMSTNFLNIDLPDPSNPTSGDSYWLQIGYTHGYENQAATYDANYRTYTENGLTKADGTITAHEYMQVEQPLNTGWDYWIRWDSTQNAWKVNINNVYTDYFMAGYQSHGKVTGEGEVNVIGSHNWGNYSNNTYYNSGGTWSSYDSAFNPVVDTGSSVSGTSTNYTVSR